jgi:hypothetical protein
VSAQQPGAWPEIVAEADEKAVAKAIASMEAFDAMPAEWREICANHGRTARGESLARLLDECGGDIDTAQWQLNAQLPIVPPPPLQRRAWVPWATYDLKAESRAMKRKRKAKA